jgi:hypothetical protein
MHAWILGVVLGSTFALAASAASEAPLAAATTCPATTGAVMERFLSAECSACWTDATVAQPDANQWLLDWIVPSARGDDAPLAPAAPSEASDRMRRALRADAVGDGALVHRTAARSTTPLPQLRVLSGPAWSGYFAVQADGSGRVPKGATVWVALVESVRAGTDGTVAPRQLVRTVAGPFEPAELRGGKPWRLLQAMRWPDTAKPERLRARAWIEQPDGRIAAMAGERCGK